MRRSPALPLLLCAVTTGCCMAHKAGNVVGGTLTDFSEGVEQGRNEQLTVAARLSPELARAGISMTTAKPHGKGIAVYLVSAAPFKSGLTARALNAEGLEIGRSAADVDLGAHDAKYVTFAFPDEMDARAAAGYEIEVRK